MKRKIEDYETENGSVGVYCCNEGEWKAICRLINEKKGGVHPANGQYMVYDFDTIGLYRAKIHGWNKRGEFKTAYPASDFLTDSNYEIY
jgi:hypothetical protein